MLGKQLRNLPPLKRRNRNKFTTTTTTTNDDHREIGISFCGGGFLGGFHVGAWDALAGRFPLWTSAAAVAGSSAGAIVGCCACSAWIRR